MASTIVTSAAFTAVRGSSGGNVRRAASVSVTCNNNSTNSGGGVARGVGMKAAPRRVSLTASTRSRRSAVRPLYGLESKGKVGGQSKELEEAGALKDPEESAEATPAEAQKEEKEEDSKADLGSEIQRLKNGGKDQGKSMAPTGDPDNDNMVVGAFEEIGQIEWPTPGAALTTTGIVIAIVTASTFVLLSVNSVSIFG